MIDLIHLELHYCFLACSNHTVRHPVQLQLETHPAILARFRRRRLRPLNQVSWPESIASLISAWRGAIDQEEIDRSIDYALRCMNELSISS